MATEQQKDTGKTGTRKKQGLIDPIYQKFTKSVIRSLGSTDFYEFFMDAISRAENEFQFSNRKLQKTVDLDWVDAIEDTLEAFQKIVSNPRNVIKEEELIVNVANAKKAGSDVVRHLAQHASLVEKFDPVEGDVRPNRVMQRYREDTIGLYENRLVYTVMENAHHFVKIRNEAIFSEMSDEFGAKLKLQTEMDSATEHVHLDMFLHIRDIDSALDTDGKHISIFDRVARLHRILSLYMNSPFAQQMAKLPRVKGAITKTNVLKKNPNYRAIVKLGEFLADYTDIGYSVDIIEQNPVITPEFQRDIFHNVLFNYLVLKGYLEREKDRRMPAPSREKKRKLKPKFIKEIIEELTEDYDLPELEIRKVLIEELTKEQLMQEEHEERLRLVEEQEQRKREEEERIRKEQEAEAERLRKEQEAEAERIRQEQAAEAERQRVEKLKREIEDSRRSKILQKELTHFEQNLEKRLNARENLRKKRITELKDFEDAVKLMEEAEQRKLEAEEREKKRLKDERDRVRRERQLAIERERQAKLEAEEAVRREQDEKDTAGTAIYQQQLTAFLEELPQRLAMRQEEIERARKAREAWEQERQRRQAERTTK